MGESVTVTTSVRRGLTLALTLFGLVLFTATMLIVQGVIYLANSPDSRAGLYWIILLILIPAVITGIVSGLAAALGARIGARGTAKAAGGSASWRAAIAGAGLGGSVGSVPLLIYLSWWYQNGPGLWILVLGYIVIFGAYAGFTALWSGRRARSIRMPV